MIASTKRVSCIIIDELSVEIGIAFEYRKARAHGCTVNAGSNAMLAPKMSGERGGSRHKNKEQMKMSIEEGGQ
jgi:hypothetical protein